MQEYPLEDKHAMLLQESVAEALRQASIEMKDSKYLKADNDDGKDDAEADADTDLFKKRTYRNSGGKLAHGKGFKSGSSFVRKRKRVS